MYVNRMAGKKKSHNHPHHSTKAVAETKDDTKKKKTTKKENTENGSKHHHQQSSSTNGIALWVCILVALLSFIIGIISPPFLKLLKINNNGFPLLSSLSSSRSLQSDSITSSTTTTKSTTMMSQFSCSNEDDLSQFLHENSIPGMHIVCMNPTNDLKTLNITLYPTSKQNVNPPTQQFVNGIPTWIQFQSMLVQSLKLRPMDSKHQPWAIYSPIGELLVKEDFKEEQVDMTKLVNVGMFLVFQGGQWIWPPVKIGFKRTIDLYTVMPVGSPSMNGKNRTATLETISLQPLVFSVEGFLDDDECNFIQEQATPTLEYSAVTLMDKDAGRPASDFRTSQSTFLGQKNHPIIKDIVRDD